MHLILTYIFDSMNEYLLRNCTPCRPPTFDFSVRVCLIQMEHLPAFALNFWANIGDNTCVEISRVCQTNNEYIQLIQLQAPLDLKNEHVTMTRYRLVEFWLLAVSCCWSLSSGLQCFLAAEWNCVFVSFEQLKRRSRHQALEKATCFPGHQTTPTIGG